MTIETPRLLIVPVDPNADPEEFLPVFNSNPDFLEASDAKRAYDRNEVERCLYAESSTENGRCLAIRLREDNSLVGTAALLVPHPAGCPWIGLLVIRGDRHREGVGREAALAIESALAGEGWDEVRLGVLKKNERALSFWLHVGYRVVDEKDDTTGRPCWVLAKQICPSSTPAS